MFALLLFIDQMSPTEEHDYEPCKVVDDISPQKKSELWYAADETVYADPITLIPISKQDLIVVDRHCFDKNTLKEWVMGFVDKTSKPTHPLTRTPISWRTLVRIGVDPSLFQHTYAKEIKKVEFDPETNSYKALKEDGRWEVIDQGEYVTYIDYYDSGKMHTRQTRLRNGKYLYEEWYENGQKKVIVRSSDGDEGNSDLEVEVKDGLQEEWYENGQMKMRVNYKDGSVHGLLEQWYENGQMKLRIKYKDDNMHGLQEQWYENGQMMVRVNFKEDKMYGLLEQWYENGQMQLRVNYKDGKKHGLEEHWYTNGEMKYIKNWKDGKQRGPEKSWDEEGNLIHSIMFSDGKRGSDSELGGNKRTRK